MTENYELCSKMSAQVQKDLELSGFVVNADESVWEPVQIIEWLGFVWNLKECTLEIPDKKNVNLKSNISNIVEGNTYLTCRNIAKICGKIILMIPAFGNICQIMTKHMHMLICCRSSWDDAILMNDSIIEELRFWYFQCNFLSFKCIISVHRITQHVYFH